MRRPESRAPEVAQLRGSTSDLNGTRRDARPLVHSRRATDLFRQEEEEHDAIGASAGGPSRAVQVVLGVSGRIVVDDQIDVVDVDSACSDISGDQDARIPAGERIERSLSL